MIIVMITVPKPWMSYLFWCIPYKFMGHNPPIGKTSRVQVVIVTRVITVTVVLIGVVMTTVIAILVLILVVGMIVV